MIAERIGLVEHDDGMTERGKGRERGRGAVFGADRIGADQQYFRASRDGGKIGNGRAGNFDGIQERHHNIFRIENGESACGSGGPDGYAFPPRWARGSETRSVRWTR